MSHEELKEQITFILMGVINFVLIVLDHATQHHTTPHNTTPHHTTPHHTTPYERARYIAGICEPTAHVLRMKLMITLKATYFSNK